MPAKPLTPEQKEDAKRLLAIYEKAKTNDPSMTQEFVADYCGWKTQSTVNQYFNGKIPLNLKALFKFCDVFGVHPEDISPELAKQTLIPPIVKAVASVRLGKLLPSSNGNRIPDSAESLTSEKENEGAIQMLMSYPDGTRRAPTETNRHVIRQYDSGGSMGHGLVMPDQPGVIENWSVSSEWLNKNVRTHTGVQNLCIVTGFGPSMQPMFNPGDPLLVDTGVKSVIADGIYFFRVGKEGFIKQLQKIPVVGGIKYVAKSKNKDFDPFDITEDMDFEVLGKVVRVWCGTDF